MLKVNQLIGFGVRGASVPPSIGGTGSSAFSTADATSYNLTVDLTGPARAGRYAIVAIILFGNAGEITVSSATLNGVSLAQVTDGVNPARLYYAAQDSSIDFYAAEVTSGTTGLTLAITTSGTSRRAIAIAFTAFDLASLTAHDITSDTVGALTLSVNTQADGLAFAAGTANSSPTSYSWVGLTAGPEDNDIGEGQWGFCSGYASGTVAATPRTITQTMASAGNEQGLAISLR